MKREKFDFRYINKVIDFHKNGGKKNEQNYWY